MNLDNLTPEELERMTRSQVTAARLNAYNTTNNTSYTQDADRAEINRHAQAISGNLDSIKALLTDAPDGVAAENELVTIDNAITTWSGLYPETAGG